MILVMHIIVNGKRITPLFINRHITLPKHLSSLSLFYTFISLLQVNNAGCMINTREVIAENLEKNFVTNTLSTHILTTNLIPLLKK